MCPDDKAPCTSFVQSPVPQQVRIGLQCHDQCSAVALFPGPHTTFITSCLATPAVPFFIVMLSRLHVGKVRYNDGSCNSITDHGAI